MSAKHVLGKTKMWLMQHGPRICTWLGVGAMGASTVIACRNTRKLDETLKPYQEEIDRIPEGPNQARDIFKVKVKAAGAVAKLYWLPATLSIGGATGIILSENKMESRFAGAVAFGNGLAAVIQNYRERVRSVVGKDDEKKLWDGYKADIVKAEAVNENGEMVETLQKQLVLPKNGKDDVSMYARYFDESCKDYSDSWEYNLMVLKKKQKKLNEKFLRDGFLFLNRVYEELGMQQTQLGCVVGWIYCDDGLHDNKVSFGLEKYDKWTGLTVQCEPRVLLDFNVDGVIWNDISKKWH